jgi:predicted metal-dependent hydrolase
VSSATASNYRHPRANRELALAGAHVAYEFQHGQRRTIGFSIGPEGLSVRAPSWVPQFEVDAALHRKAAWIVRKLGEARERRPHQDILSSPLQDGVVLSYLGQPLLLHVAAPHSGKSVLVRVEPLAGAPATLSISLPLRKAEPTHLREAVLRWLMQYAHAHFVTRLNHYAPLLGVRWQRLGLSNASTRWGSASADGSIRLNWRLVHLRPELIDYVVAHELSHLREMNHSPRFWATVASVMPDYALLRAELKRHQVSA